MEASAMADVPVQLIVAAFQTETGAEEALKDLKEAKKEKLVNVKDAAILRKDAQGELHIRETGDMTGGRGGMIGGVVGAGLGIITGGATFALAGLGAAAGGLAAKLRDSGFKDDRLRKLGQGLKPSSSAIVAVIEHTWVADAEAHLRQAGAQVVVESISTDIAEQLEAGREVAYTAVADNEGGAAAGRVVSEPNQPSPSASAPVTEVQPQAADTDIPPERKTA
jgi:uncharacterized membrane protein